MNKGPRKGGAATKRFVWQKLSPAKWEDVWQERLGWLGQRLVMILLAGYKTLRIEAHQLTRIEAEGLMHEFRGRIRPAQPFTAADLEPQPRPPIKVGRRLAVIGQERDRESLAGSNVPVLHIPPSMAFGTGEHATTSTCLRVLAEVTKEFAAGSWEALDLGTGSGILGLAARMLGARKVDAWDFDPTAIRVAKVNAKLNAVRMVSFQRVDVLRWTPSRQWDVVVANVYGPILIEAARQIADAVAVDGFLILSGILREQADDVVAAFRSRAMDFERVLRKGKWVTAIARKRKKATQRRTSNKRSPKKTKAAPSTRSNHAARRVVRNDRAPRPAK